MKSLQRHTPGVLLASTLVLGVAGLSAIATVLNGPEQPPSARATLQALADNLLASAIFFAAMPAILAVYEVMKRRRVPNLWAGLVLPVGGLTFAACHFSWTLLVYRLSDAAFSTARPVAVGPIALELAREVTVFALLVIALLLPLRFIPRSEAGETTLAVKDSGVDRRLRPSDITSIKASRNYVVIHHLGGETTVRTTLAEIADQLPDGRFVRVNRSAVVRLSAICELRRDGPRDHCVVLDSGESIRVRRGFESDLRALMRG